MRISKQAVDPTQYDRPHVKWEDEGGRSSPIRRLFLEHMSPFLGQVAGKRVIDVGCGQGWLCGELNERGATPVGIDPSRRNILTAKRNFPDLDFEQNSLLGYRGTLSFDAVTAVMVFEHIEDLKMGYTKVIQLLRDDDSRFLMVVADFQKATNSRPGCKVETEALGPGEVATRSDYGSRAGVLYDINRTTERFINDAHDVGLRLVQETAIIPPDWLIKEYPHYEPDRDKPRFHMLEFANQLRG